MTKRRLLALALIAAAAVGWFSLSERRSSVVDQPSAIAAPPPYAPPLPTFDAALPAADPAGPYEALHGAADCTDDCSGHEAGYQWAEDNDISDEDQCVGNSESFIEGCKAYVTDNGG